MKITLAQLNPTIGDIRGNVAKVTQTLSQCSKDSPDLVVFPELFLVGYPPRDLLERPSFIAKTEAAIQELLHVSHKCQQTIPPQFIQHNGGHIGFLVRMQRDDVNVVFVVKIHHYLTDGRGIGRYVDFEQA